MREPRPYRDALAADEAAAQLRSEVKAGLRDAESVEAVLGAAGHRAVRRREGPAGLTAARGRCPPAARPRALEQGDRARLVISPKTVGNHIEHIYAKIGASTRAAASLFAMQHGLLPEEDFRRGGEYPMAAARTAT